MSIESPAKAGLSVGQAGHWLSAAGQRKKPVLHFKRW
jgi:hypothetical protein